MDKGTVVSCIKTMGEYGSVGSLIGYLDEAIIIVGEDWVFGQVRNARLRSLMEGSKSIR